MSDRKQVIISVSIEKLEQVKKILENQAAEGVIIDPSILLSGPSDDLMALTASAMGNGASSFSEVPERMQF